VNAIKNSSDSFGWTENLTEKRGGGQPEHRCGRISYSLHIDADWQILTSFARMLLLPLRRKTTMPTINISLPDTLKIFVEEQIDAGGYSTVSEYFRELIREDQKRRSQEKLETLLMEGINSGKSALLTKKDIEKVRRSVRARIVRRKK
jgi:antitoxin ParD1/3/4